MTQYYGGCDLGSTTGKFVILDDHGLVASSIIPRKIDPTLTAETAFDEAAEQVRGLNHVQMLSCLIGTGYGRNEVPFANENISEITCHAIGAHFCNPEIRTIIDIGGQDVKAIALNDDGTVKEFAMNDKCAAGTGRFFEAMARIFQMSLDEMSTLSLHAQKTVPVTAQCSVFAETEVISLLNKRTPPADVAAGINMAICRRVFAMSRRAGVVPKVTVTGGCAKNQGLLKSMSEILHAEITPLSIDPQLMGALGAAVLARRKAQA